MPQQPADLQREDVLDRRVDREVRAVERVDRVLEDRLRPDARRQRGQPRPQHPHRAVDEAEQRQPHREPAREPEAERQLHGRTSAANEEPALWSSKLARNDADAGLTKSVAKASRPSSTRMFESTLRRSPIIANEPRGARQSARRRRLQENLRTANTAPADLSPSSSASCRSAATGPCLSSLKNCARHRGRCSSSSSSSSSKAAAAPTMSLTDDHAIGRRHDQPHDAVARDDGLQPVGALRERPAVHAVRADLHLGQPVPLARPVRRREGREALPVRGPPSSSSSRTSSRRRTRRSAGWRSRSRRAPRGARARSSSRRVGRGEARRRRSAPPVVDAMVAGGGRRPPAHRARPPVVAGARGVRERADEPYPQLVALRQVPPARYSAGGERYTARIRTYLLERSRVVSPPEEVRNSGAILRNSAKFCAMF